MTRIAGDKYYSPESMVRPLLKWLCENNFKEYGNFFEPCVGTGTISNLVRSGYPDDCTSYEKIITNDYDKNVKATLHHDATSAAFWASLKEEVSIDTTITNPPFFCALPIVEAAVTFTNFLVAMYLPITWLEPTYEREDFVESNPPTAQLVLPRVKFIEGRESTDRVTGVWNIWDKTGTLPKGIKVFPRRTLTI